MAIPAPKLGGTLGLAGIPGRSWAFAIRIWLALIGALYVAFWLQIDGASAAGTTVAILALQTRGQAFHKAAYRLFGTLIGVVASVAIAGLFSQARDLYLVAFAAWLGACVFVAGLLDGNRAYGAVLAGYTVASVTVRQIDNPQNVFLGGVNQAAAIVIGIAALALVDDIFAAPDFHPGVLARLTAAQGKMRVLARAALGGAQDSGGVGHLLTDITALHPDITSLASEWPSGVVRARAARRAVWSLIGALEAIRTLWAATDMRGVADDETRKALEAALSDSDGQAPVPVFADVPHDDGDPASLDRFLVATCLHNLLAQDHAVSDALEALRAGRFVPRTPDLPIYRSRLQAARNALRAFLTIAIAGFALVHTGWPGTSAALSLLGIVVGLSATNPNPIGFATIQLKALPVAALAVGVTEFLILDGVGEFPLLALAMAPTVFLACLCIATGNLNLFTFGLLLLIFLMVILQPTNPQSYNPQTYLFSSVLDTTAAVILYVALVIILPTTDTRKRGWLRRSVKSELKRAVIGSCDARSEAARTYKAADRVGQLAALRDATVDAHEADLRHAMYLSDLSAAFRRARSATSALAEISEIDEARLACESALFARDPDRIRHATEQLRGFGPPTAHAALALAWEAKLIAAYPPERPLASAEPQ